MVCRKIKGLYDIVESGKKFGQVMKTMWLLFGKLGCHFCNWLYGWII